MLYNSTHDKYMNRKHVVVRRHSFDDVGVIQQEAVIFAESGCRKGQTPLVSHVSNTHV